MANDRNRNSGQSERPASQSPRGIEQPPDLTDEDDAALDRAWARIAAEDKAKEAARSSGQSKRKTS
jgi:hypothetical protein